MDAGKTPKITNQLAVHRERTGRHSSVLRPAFILLLTACLLVGCGEKKTAHVTLFFTAQTHGRLTHCGCFSGQFGGVARLKTALESPSLNGAVGVDLGNAIEGSEDFEMIKHRYLSGAFAKMGYVAMNVGHREASLSAAELRQLAATSPVPLISANLLDRATGKSLLPGWKIIQRDGRRIALIGVLDSVGMDDTLGAGLEIEPIDTCLSRLLPEVKKQADVLVLLAFTDEATLSALAQQYYEFSAILGGRVSQPAQSLGRENSSLIYYTANEGKSFGQLELIVGADGKVEPGTHTITLLTNKIPEDAGVLAQNNAYREEIRHTRLALDDPAYASANEVPGTHATATFTGTESCVKCHASAAAIWQGSRHAGAFAALVAVRADADPSCVGCHTIGFEKPSGYRRENGDSRLTNVGCESCHGPGSTHLAQRTGGGPVTFHFRPLAAGDCMKCHNGEFSRPFVWNAFWPLVQHGKN
jgi:hypothetical protein